ncbi:unnamed protein product, partial [Didymodactylos carnosus]
VFGAQAGGNPLDTHWNLGGRVETGVPIYQSPNGQFSVGVGGCYGHDFYGGPVC